MRFFAKVSLPVLAFGAFLFLTAPASAAEPDKLLPSDAEGVVVVNLRQLLDSPVVKKYALAKIKEGLAKDDKVAKPLAAAGIDPLKDIDSILVAASGNPASNKMLVVVRGRFDLDKIGATVDELAKKSDGKLKVVKEGDVRLYEVQGDDKPGYLAFKDNKTLVASQNKEYTAEVASGKAAGKPGKAIVGALDKVSGKDSIWFAAVITDEMKKAMGKNPNTAGIAPKLEAITGGINLSDFLLATILIHTADEESAGKVKMLVDQVKPLLSVLAAQANEDTVPVINELLQSIKVNADKSGVSISLKVTEDLVKKLNKKPDPQ